MGVGPNYGLNKGYLATGGSVAYAEGELIVSSAAEQSCARATSASAVNPLGVCTESVDATKVATGKVFVGVALTGIVRVKSGAAVAKDDRITNDTSARGVTRARTAAGSQPLPVFGIALTATTGANQYFDMLLTPGATY